jgi:hypothetical protein
MYIIQNILQYYIKETTKIDALNPKVIKLTYIKKTTFDINGTTIHFALAISLNKIFNE